MSREEKLHEMVHGAAADIASAALNAGDGEEFLLQICGWTEEEIDVALSGCTED